MKYFDYMEARFVTRNIQLQEGFTPWVNAETKAAHWLIGLQRKLFIFIQVPRLLLCFTLYKLRIMAPPQTAASLIEEYNATAKAKIAAAQEKQRNDKLREQGRGLEATDNVLDLKPTLEN